MTASDYRKDFPLLQNEDTIYIDNAATAQRPQAVLDAVKVFYETENANPLRGFYPLSLKATESCENARATVRDFIHATSKKEIIFTRNTTEGLNLVAYSYGLSHLKAGDEIAVTIMEHHSNLLPWQMVASQTGAELNFMECETDGTLTDETIQTVINEKTKLVEIQRSKGYMTRPSFSVKQIGELIAFVKSIKPDVICMVDNCYGEFVDTIEPSDVGADMVVGSLIKNPGGGLAPIGGYIAGTKECVENASYRMTCPGLGAEVGASLGVNRSFYQGFFLAPMVTKGALKGAVFAANIYEKLGFDVVPNSTEPRQDIIQAVTLKSPERLIAFCKGIQAAAPVDSYVDPEPWDMPGYDSQVIMAAGAFVQGSSIELSADGPVKEPYAVYFQGGLTWEHAKLGVMMSLQKLVEQDLVKLQ